MSARRKPKTVAEGWVPLRHGIPSSYNRGCHCDECRAANAARARNTGNNRNHRTRNFEERVWVETATISYWYAVKVDRENHGTHDCYTRFGCRCPECVRGNALYQKSRRQAQRGGGDRSG